MDTVASISVPRLRSLVGSPRAPLVVDVRKLPAFDADPVMIASALRRPHDAVGDWAAGLSAGREIVAYCVHGHEVSQGVAHTLAERGVPVGSRTGKRPARRPCAGWPTSATEPRASRAG